ncbi:MAG: 2Fe-2S iron-sulfur cluster-binding protein [Blautia wexlerae]
MLTIDGIPVEVEKGTTILQAARQIGVEIPTLCYLEDVLPDGSCRLCVVEVTNNGRTKFDTACTLSLLTRVMKYQTMSEKVVACQERYHFESASCLTTMYTASPVQANGRL